MVKTIALALLLSGCAATPLMVPDAPDATPSCDACADDAKRATCNKWIALPGADPAGVVQALCPSTDK